MHAQSKTPYRMNNLQVKTTQKHRFDVGGNLQLRNHLAALLHPRHGIVHKLVDDGLGRLLLIHDGGALAHEEGAELLEGVVVLVLLAALRVHDLVEVGLVGDGALGGELLHLGGAVDLPVVDVVVVPHAHGAAGEDDGADVVVVAGGANGLLVRLGRSRLVGEDEARADPHGRGAHHERRRQELAVEDAARGDDQDGAAGEGRLGLVADLDDRGDEDGRGDVTGVAAALAALRADDVDADVDALLDVLDVADHVHVEDARGVELVHDGLGGHADGGDEDLGLLLNDDVDELVELALGVVIAVAHVSNSALKQKSMTAMRFHM